MKKIYLSTVFLVLSLYCLAQNIQVTFTAFREATTIDSITAKNQRTNQSVTFPGSETLVLSQSSGIKNIASPENQLAVYPNPFSSNSIVAVTLDEPVEASLIIHNLTGQVLAQKDEALWAGNNDFSISLSEKGLYIFILKTKQACYSCKLVNTSSSGRINMIQHMGVGKIVSNRSDSFIKKSENAGYSLDFTEGDNMHFTCYSGVMTIIFTDYPESSKNYDVEFVYCSDDSGRNYKVVIIGDQIWMEENLAYLPSVGPSSERSTTTPYYYVYDYKGTSVSEAKTSDEYKDYGVLYNWQAAKISCPDKWQLPDDSDWASLKNYLTSNGYGYGGKSIDIGKSLASRSGWNDIDYAGYIGNDQASNNSSGFNAFPCGFCRASSFRNPFESQNETAYFWSSSGLYDYGLMFNNFLLSKRSTSISLGISVRCILDK